MPKSEGSQRGLLLAMMLGLFVAGLDASVVNIIIPKLETVFHTSAAQVMLVATVYLSVMGAFQLVLGKCADLLSPILVFLGGVLFFFVGSLACTLSAGLEQLLLGRALQGLGGAMLSAAVGGVILKHFPREKTGSILGSILTVMAVGTIIGPPLGGYLAEHHSWRWAFALNLPLCFFSFLLLFPYLKASLLKFQNLAQLDLKGAGFSVVMLLSLPSVFSMAAESGWQEPRVWAVAVLFLVSLLLFGLVERKAPNPLLHPAIFQTEGLALTAGLRVLLFVAFNGILLVFPFFLTGSCGLSVSEAGWVILASAVSMAFTTRLFGGLSDRWGSESISLFGALCLLFMASGSLLLDGESLWLATASLVGFGFAVSATMVSSSVQMLRLAPQGQEGVFSALNFLMAPVGGSLGLAFFSYLWSSGGGVALSRFQSSMQGVFFCALLMTAASFVLKRQARRRFGERQIHVE